MQKPIFLIKLRTEWLSFIHFKKVFNSCDGKVSPSYASLIQILVYTVQLQGIITLIIIIRVAQASEQRRQQKVTDHCYS